MTPNGKRKPLPKRLLRGKTKRFFGIRNRMVTRELRREDFDDLVETYYQCYEEWSEGLPRGFTLFLERPTIVAEVAWFDSLLESVAGGRTVAVVAEVEGKAVGLCTVATRGPGPASELSHVGELGILVRRGLRGRGIGSELMTAALERSRERFEIIVLGVFEDNVGARRLYERLGFRSGGKVPRAIK